MNYDTIIIGGGLAGLVAGIILQERGQRTAIITTGRSAPFQFWLGGVAVARHRRKCYRKTAGTYRFAPGGHPYKKVGAARTGQHAREAKALFERAGIAMLGSETANHYYLTPVGLFKPTWLSTVDSAVSPAPDGAEWGKTAIVGIKGFLDFYPGFIADNLSRAGLKCEVGSLRLPNLNISARIPQKCVLRALPRLCMAMLSNVLLRQSWLRLPEPRLS